MAQRFAGVAFCMVDGNQVPLRGNFTVSPAMVERTMIAGQDGVHGYQELPRVPYIEGDLSHTRDLDLAALERQVNVTVIAQLANGWPTALNLSSRLSTAPGSTSSRASFPNLRALCCATFALPPSKNSRIGSCPPWITSTKSASVTRCTIRSTTKLEYDSNFRNDDLGTRGGLVDAQMS